MPGNLEKVPGVGVGALSSGKNGGSEHPQVYPNNAQSQVDSFSSLSARDLEMFMGEAGHAEVFAKIFRGHALFDRAAKVWFTWDGVKWAEDHAGIARRWVSNQLASVYLRAASELVRYDTSENARERADRLIGQARELHNLRTINNVLVLAADQPGMSVIGDEWDSKPWFLLVRNGTIDLTAGKLRASDPNDMLKAQCPTKFISLDTPAPRFERFLAEIFDGDNELIDFIQRLFGYAITGSTRDHILPILFGAGRNGKSVLLETIGKVLGRDLASAIAADSLMDTGKDGSAATPYIVGLRGKRLVWASESNDGRSLNAGLVKQLTGGDTITARGLYSAPITFAPTHKVLLVTNHKPGVDTEDEALWDRLAPIPFTMRFVDEPRHATERQKDSNLPETLQSEASGILAWLVKGCLVWQRDGLRLPQAVKAEIAEWRDKADPLAGFVSAMCKVGRAEKAGAGVLYDAYRAWMTATDQINPLSKNVFSDELGKKYIKKHTMAGKLYQGIGLKT